MTHRENFDVWYAGLIEDLLKREHTGVPVLMIVFPLLERYVRQKVGVSPDDKNFNGNSGVHQELQRLFAPDLKTEDDAKNFWHIYRNGLLHQVTFVPSKDKTLRGMIAETPEVIVFTAHGDVALNVHKFAARVITEIRDNFAVFEGSSPELPRKFESPKGSHPVTGVFTITRGTGVP